MSESSKGFEMTSLVAKTTATMRLIGPSGKEIEGVSFELVGRDSDQYQRTENDIMIKRFQRMRNRQLTIDPAAQKQDDIRLLAACIVGWTGITMDGKEFPFSKENAVLLLGKVPAIKEQIDVFVGDRANFL